MVNVIRDADMVDSIIITGCEYTWASSLKNNYPESQVFQISMRGNYLIKKKLHV